MPEPALEQEEQEAPGGRAGAECEEGGGSQSASWQEARGVPELPMSCDWEPGALAEGTAVSSVHTEGHCAIGQMGLSWCLWEATKSQGKECMFTAVTYVNLNFKVCAK